MDRLVIRVDRVRKPAPAKNRPSCFIDRCENIDGWVYGFGVGSDCVTVIFISEGDCTVSS